MQDTCQLLPRSVKPNHYRLELTPDFEDFTFEGQVIVDLTVLEDCDKVVLNAKDLDIKTVTVSSNQVTEITVDKQLETVGLQLSSTLAKDSYVTVSLEFTGVLNDLMSGFYRSRYQDAHGQTKYIASTHFEPTYARMAFPCWDEPGLKATFDVILNVHPELTALSNMDVNSSKASEDGKFKKVVFNTTPRMSTYLLAFVVGEFDYVEGLTKHQHNGRQIPCRVYTSPGKSFQGQFALYITLEILDYYARTFAQDYPLPKLDQIAINEFQIGGMENWGLITYRETYLLVNPKQTSSNAKQNVAYVVAHELAHQWFGNLVTMEWWTDLWLKEGFATWVGTLAVDVLFPEYQAWTHFLLGEFDRAMTLDSLVTSHQIVVPVNKPSDISQIFDAISYSKGASVIRMVCAYVGQENFFKGLRAYLSKHQYGNAESRNLWDALSEASGKDVATFMELWTLHTGYPVIEVIESDGSKRLQLKQSRYLSSSNSTSTEDDCSWKIPLLLTTDSQTKPDNSLAMEQEQMICELPSNSSWYKLNTGAVGLYRVKYLPSAICSLTQAIRAKQLGTNDRIQIVSDLAALASSGHARTSQFLTILKAFEDESDNVVWGTISLGLSKLQASWSSDLEMSEMLKQLVGRLFGKVIGRLGWASSENEDEQTRENNQRLRALAIQRAGASGTNPTVVDEAIRRIHLYITDQEEEALSPDLFSAALQLAVNQGGSKEYQLAKQFYIGQSGSVDQRLFALVALGYTSDSALFNEALEFALHSEEVRNQDLHYVLAKATKPHTEQMWSWFKANYQVLFDRYKQSTSYMANLVKFVTAKMVGKEWADKVTEFFKDKETARFDRAIEQSIENMKAKEEWYQRDHEDVKNWFDSK